MLLFYSQSRRFYSAMANKTRKNRFTFSQSVFTWVSLSCLHSISCSIHDSKSFAVALSSTIVIVEVLRVSKITPLFNFLRKSDKNEYKSTRISLYRLLPLKFNVRKTLWRSTNLDIDEAHVRNLPNMGSHSIFVFASPLGSSPCQGSKACLAFLQQSWRVLRFG